MKIKLLIGPVNIFKNDQSKVLFSHEESGHWLNIIDINFGGIVSDRVQVILIELLENAIFHNVYDDSDIEYEIEINCNIIKVRVMNRVNQEQKNKVIRKINVLNNCKDLNKEYARIMSENEEGGVGLIRLMTEQECSLNIIEKSDDYIQIEARIEL